MTAQELKNSVLRRAIRGELVERRAEEGTGAELLKQIEAEKAALTKAGKLKKEKPLPPITEEEKPFEIPERWTWTRLGECCEMYTGNSIAESVKKEKYAGLKEGYDYIGTKDVSFEQTVQYDNGVRIPLDEGFKIAPQGSVLMCVEGGSAGRKIGALDRDVCFGNKLCMFRAYLAYNRLIFYYLQSGEFQAMFSDNMTGIIGGVSIKKLKEILIPLPPLAEQARIVAKLEEIWPEIERYAAARDELEALNRRFPNDLRKAVLQSAIRGELVERRAEEGTGAELLKQIEAEKASLTKAGKLKKEKPLPPITDEEKPFEIPEHWTWTRLGEIGRLLSGQDMPPSLYNANRLGIPYITGASNIEDSQVIINRWTDSPKAVATCGCLLLTCKGTVGKTAILKEQQVHIARQLMAITPILVGVRYIRFFIETQIDFLKSQAKSMIPGIERKNVLNLPIPLPPLAEQARIVAKLEEILPLCDRLR
ncbi:MAG: restriction endonuclease subunit S [Thermoguttaceae bacterium]|nr:restriction endonuclease subunit S [Thermoguttaceae bacterium]MBR4104358.1 restriction endonuclease subunit S [Thermoguttaceae bacterium]